MLCPVCRGRGEVECGIVGAVSVVKYGPEYTDYDGQTKLRAQYPTKIKVNPNARIKIHTGNKDTDYYDLAILRLNPIHELWSICVCGKCHGTGMIWQ